MPNELMNTSAIETIDSREVAEMIEVRHDNLVKKIRNYQQILDSSKLRSQDFFVPSTYINSQNKEQPCYLLTKKGCEMVANKLTGEKGVIFTAKYVNRFEEMENHIKQQVPALPNNYLEALEQLVSEVKMNEQLILENNQLKLKLECKGLDENRIYSVNEIAQEHDMSARELNNFLFDKGVQYTRKGRWYLYRKYRNKGYTKGFHGWLKWTNEGKLFIEQLLNNQGKFL
jgi:Rha family phage regulatory protein